MGGEETRGHVSVAQFNDYAYVWCTLPFTDFENSSDADSDVLGDYVLALIRAETPEPELRLSAISNLEDFLQESTYGRETCDGIWSS